jgi:hypothetical protein
MAEMLLHAVLRHHLKSEPIACKLFVKSGTSTKVFGNAHIVHSNPDHLWLGRANVTTSTTYESVLASIAAELEGVLSADFLKEEREVIISLREPQHLLPTTLETAFRANTPIDDLLSVMCIAVLIAYDSDVLKDGFIEDYRAKLISEITQRYENIKPGLPQSLKKLRLHIFLVPIECVSTLLQQFQSEIEGH